MSEIYGHRWASQQGDEPNDTWVKGCADLSNEQLGNGLRNCLNRPDGWPPSLPEFRVLCQDVERDPNWERQCHRVVTNLPAIEDLSAKEARCAEGLRQIRGLRERVGL